MTCAYKDSLDAWLRVGREQVVTAQQHTDTPPERPFFFFAFPLSASRFSCVFVGLFVSFKSSPPLFFESTFQSSTFLHIHTLHSQTTVVSCFISNINSFDTSFLSLSALFPLPDETPATTPHSVQSLNGSRWIQLEKPKSTRRALRNN